MAPGPSEKTIEFFLCYLQLHVCVCMVDFTFKNISRSLPLFAKPDRATLDLPSPPCQLSFGTEVCCPSGWGVPSPPTHHTHSLCLPPTLLLGLLEAGKDITPKGPRMLLKRPVDREFTCLCLAVGERPRTNKQRGIDCLGVTLDNSRNDKFSIHSSQGAVTHGLSRVLPPESQGLWGSGQEEEPEAQKVE